MHGLSGDIAMKNKSVYSMTAQDLITSLPEVFLYRKACPLLFRTDEEE
jgi:NAD(P)H-hydrate repair Nnr-like enzyme with NAD(P)H-hydrate dehydratase domain